MKKQTNINLTKRLFLNLCLLLTIMLMTYCNSSSILDNTTPSTETADFVVTNTSVTPATKTVTASTPTVNVQLKFTPTSGKKLTRIYFTRNAFGNGDMPYKLEDLLLDKKTARATLKADGSIDLPTSMKDGTNFILPLPVKLSGETETEGTIVYRIWATGGSWLGGKGDHRDPSNENVIATAAPYFAKVVIQLGTVASTVQVQTKTVVLKPPLADGTSETFFSLLTCEKQVINNGVEKYSLWDFGYSYLNSTGASLQSAKEFSLGTVTTQTMAGLTADQAARLNVCYFKKDAAMTDAAFDALTSETINGFSVGTLQKVSGLTTEAANKYVQFQDAYGAKGVIKVTSLTTGDGSAGALGITIKYVPLSLN